MEDRKKPLGQSDLAVTMIEGGVQTNVIPDKCGIRADIRTVPPQSHSSFINRLKSKLNLLEDQGEIFKYSVETLLDRPSILTDPAEDIIHLAQMIKGGLAADQYGVSYYTDGAVLNPRSEIPTLIYGPGDEKLAHQPNEWVSLDAYQRSIQFYRQLIMSYGKLEPSKVSSIQGGKLLNSILIKNAEIVTMNATEEIIFGDLYIVDDRVAEIGQNLTHQADKVIDASGKTVIPGFIQTHIHLCQTLFRGQADDLESLDWLKQKIWPLEASHDEESIYYSAMLGIGELLQSGTTTVVDMETVNHTEYAFQAIAESGIRALAGKVMMDKGDEVPVPLRENTSASIQQSVDLLEKWHNRDNGRIQYAFCPRFVVSCTEELLTNVRDLSAQYDVKVHTHASENFNEILLVEKELGMRNVVYLDSIGLANERLILAHCVWLNEEEKESLKSVGLRSAIVQDLI